MEFLYAKFLGRNPFYKASVEFIHVSEKYFLLLLYVYMYVYYYALNSDLFFAHYTNILFISLFY